MSWRLGKSKKATLTPDRDDAASTRSITPTPGDDKPHFRTGILSIRVLWAEGISVPQGTQVPAVVQAALSSQQAMVAASISPASVSQSRLAARGKRDSVQRTQCWWLPYIVMEFEVNQILITPLGGELDKPLYMYPGPLSYLRKEEPKRGADDDMGNDVFLGGIKFTPDFDNLATQDQWYDLNGGSGKILVGVSFQPSSGRPLAIDDFELTTVIGKGSFGKVMQVRKRDTQRIYALKTIRKAHIVDPWRDHAYTCRTLSKSLYLVLAFVNGGELFHHLQREQKFNEERSRFYSAELLLALEHLHDLDVVYRDLKPENILLDYTGHIALCDFGLCKLNMKDHDMTNTFCGTPEYLAPEILNDRTIDWWTLGVLLYEMLVGLPPFYDEITDKMYEKILRDPLVFPDEVAASARSILTGLLTRDPAQRLGVNGAEEIKRHPFFEKIDWQRLAQKKIQPPFKPSVRSPVDVSNFDTVFTAEQPLDSVVEGSQLSQTVQAQFEGFSYNARGLTADAD
ncbi:AGC/Akt protein kinase [Lactarius sanguifluus]|nr:AGC/Akt protein kinase [Lactarius sanguifluus]